MWRNSGLKLLPRHILHILLTLQLIRSTIFNAKDSVIASVNYSTKLVVSKKVLKFAIHCGGPYASTACIFIHLLILHIYIYIYGYKQDGVPLNSQTWLMEIQAYFEEVPKAPVPQHFKESVMVSIFSNIVQIVVFPSSSYALLRVNSSSEFGKVTTWINCSKENWLELERGICTYIEKYWLVICTEKNLKSNKLTHTVFPWGKGLV